MDPCWIWTGNLNAKGYGRYAGRYVHRLVYETLVGPVPDGYLLHHVCETPACCNPKHLKPVSRSSHQVEPHSMATLNRAKTRCPQGHEYTEENTRLERRADGGDARRCLTCEKARGTRRRKTAEGESNWDRHRSDTCKRGHDLTKAKVAKNGTRKCEECRRIRDRARYALHGQARGH